MFYILFFTFISGEIRIAKNQEKKTTGINKTKNKKDFAMKKMHSVLVGSSK